MEIEINKQEDSQEINLTLWIKLAKDYSSCFNEEESSEATNEDCNINEETNEFLHSLLPSNNLLIVYDKQEKTNVDGFIMNLLSEIMGSVVPESTHVLDCVEDCSVFQSETFYVSKRITKIKDGFEYMEELINQKDRDDTDIYLILNEPILYYEFDDHNRFMNDLKQLLQTPKVHVICITSAYDCLCKEVIDLFSHRISFWIGSSEASDNLFSSDIACHTLMDWSVYFSNDYGKTATEKDYVNSNIDDEILDEPLLDI